MTAKKLSSLALILGLMLSSCAAMKKKREHKQAQAQASTSQTKQAEKARQEQRAVASYYSLTVDFRENQTHLTEDARQKLRNLVEYVRNNHNIKEIEVAAWSDKPFPPEPNSEYIARDQKLAEMRLESVKNYLNEDMNVSWFDIQSYNMAEETGMLARLFNTDSSELKSIFARRGGSDNVNAENLRIIRDRGAPSKAVVVIKAEPKQ